jgi:CheY-like chemotaxis protein
MIASTGHDDGDVRAIASALAAAVQAVVDAAAQPEADPRALAYAAAADVAEILNLEGLAALLAACKAHAAAPPTAVMHVHERLARLAHAARASGEITTFAHADRELGALAGQLDAQQWSAPTPREPAPQVVLSLVELLSDLELDDAEAIANASLTLPVAAGLRAALDWIGADLGGALQVRVHDSTLSLGTRVMHEPGLGPAGAVLALSGGALLPGPDGRWAVRVPLHAETPAFLLARQGDLLLALPWSAVARLRIADENARAAMTEPSLTPWSPLVRTHGERPAALLALGLTRAWLHLDHIVWRVFAQPEPAQASDRVPGGRTVVRLEDGGEYSVVEVGEALRGVPMLHAPPAQPRTRAHVEPVPPESAPARAVDQVLAATGPDAPPEPLRLVALTPEHVRPLLHARPQRSEPARVIVFAPAPAAPVAAAPVAAAPVAAAPVLLDSSSATPLIPAPAPEPAQRRALVVDDSFVARLGLARALEGEGYVVEYAESAREMWAGLETGSWSVVFVDVSLPDARDRAHLRALVARQLVSAHRFELVALTRDAAEEQWAADTGITRTLRKPFRPGVAEGLVRDLPVPPVGA